MLHPFIIEQIKKREEEERRRKQQPEVRLPLPDRPMPIVPDRKPPRDEDKDGGVVVIEV